MIPPTGACVLDGILAIKHKIDEYNRLVERKLRLCAHGGQQIAGLDYNESYAPAILATSLRLSVVLACHLGVWLFHLDVSNAFQSTPDGRARLKVKKPELNFTSVSLKNVNLHLW